MHCRPFQSMCSSWPRWPLAALHKLFNHHAQHWLLGSRDGRPSQKWPSIVPLNAMPFVAEGSQFFPLLHDKNWQGFGGPLSMGQAQTQAQMLAMRETNGSGQTVDWNCASFHDWFFGKLSVHSTSSTCSQQKPWCILIQNPPFM